ncbi:MAG: thiol-disulfide isomerase/thioredoxin [Candidatus Azotimanducaceae bacterium]|jgi:thiol-disulfide isomerase/thioredoxin
MLIHLYTTLGCHLCEDAHSLLVQYQQATDANIEIVLVEISDSEDLIEAYGIRIPVLKLVSSNLELGWPFDAIALGHFLE